MLTHWGRVTHICKIIIIGSDNGLSPGRRQAIIWTDAGILLNWRWGTNFSEISIEIYIFSFKKMYLKMSSGKWWPCCLGHNVLTEDQIHNGATLDVAYPILSTYHACWCPDNLRSQHYSDVIMDAIASQITSLTIVYSTVYSGRDQRKHQSSASLAFVWGIHRWPVNSPHKWPVTQKMFPVDGVIMRASAGMVLTK